jgi:hypothetical protein
MTRSGHDQSFGSTSACSGSLFAPADAVVSTEDSMNGFENNVREVLSAWERLVRPSADKSN